MEYQYRSKKQETHKSIVKLIESMSDHLKTIAHLIDSCSNNVTICSNIKLQSFFCIHVFVNLIDFSN